MGGWVGGWVFTLDCEYVVLDEKAVVGALGVGAEEEGVGGWVGDDVVVVVEEGGAGGGGGKEEEEEEEEVNSLLP